MKTQAITKILFLTLYCVFAAGCQPNPETIGGKVQPLLQKKLDYTFGNDDVKVASILAIREAGNKYQGVANITAFNTSVITLKLAIVADGNNVIYETTPFDWLTFVGTINQQKLKAIEDQYSNVAVINNAVFSCFPKTLRQDRAVFAERLATVSPVQLEANFWFGSGCKAHECGTEAAAWAIDKDSAKGYAVILTHGVAGPTFSIYSDEPYKLPDHLISWAIENGMNRTNFIAVKSPKALNKINIENQG